MTKISGEYPQQGVYATTEYDAWPLIPEEVSNEIQGGVVAESAVLTMLTQLPNMTSRTQRMPVLATLGSAEFTGNTTTDSLAAGVGADVQVDDARMLALKGTPYGTGDPGEVPNEGMPGLKPTLQMAWENVYIVAEPIAIMLPVPDDVLDDSSYPIWDAIRPRIIEAFGRRIDEAAIWGVRRPVTWPSGIVPTAIARGQVVQAGTGADLGIDFSNVMGILENQGFDPTGFMAPPAVKARLRNIRDNNGQPIFANGNLQGGVPDAVYGLPIKYIKNASFRATVAAAICGAMSEAKFAIRTDMSWYIAKEGIISDENGKVILNALQQDCKIMRVVMRLGWAVPNPISQLNPDRGGYPFSVLTV